MSVSELIVRLAARGDGVTTSGRYVPLAAPGDRVDEQGALESGPHHATPPCLHFRECGGCQLQHVDDAAYADFLRDRIVTALRAQGLSLPEIRPPHISPPRTRRRAALHAERRERGVQIGFMARTSHRSVDMRECPILLPQLFALVAPLRALLAVLLPPRRRAQAYLTLCDQGVDLLLHGVAADNLAAIEALTGFACAHDLARLAVDDRMGAQIQWQPEPATVTLSGVPVLLPTGAFLQATREGEWALIAAVHEAVAGASRAADLFAGLGTFALALPGRVTAVEGARDALAALQSAAASAGRPVTTLHRDLYRSPLEPDELAGFDAVVLDPPRAGAKEQTMRLAASRVPVIGYVSCNPVTFARDAKLLGEGGYAIDWIQPVGQFRWSTHVELAARLLR
ncbi:MAG: class I SAM-dependent RNA methyltransferase [Sphingosinicella sp.]